MTPPSAYRGPSSSQKYYRPEISFHASDEGSQYVEVEETDDEIESPLLPHNLKDDHDDPHERHLVEQAAIIEECYCIINLSYCGTFLYFDFILFKFDHFICMFAKQSIIFFFF